MTLSASSRLLGSVLACCLVVNLTTRATAGPSVYIHDSAGRFGTLDVTTGQFQSAGLLPTPMLDVALSPTGQLFGVDGNNLWQINPTSAAATLVGSVGPFLNALVFDPKGTLYAAGYHDLWRLNPTTASAYHVGHFSPYSSSGDLEFDPAGNLYLTTGTGDLLRLDPASARSTLVGNMGFFTVYGLTLADGVLYGFDNDERATLSIDLNTASATLISRFSPPLSGASGASTTSYPANSAAPEPSTLLLLVYTLPFAALRRVRRTRPTTTDYPLPTIH